LPFTIPENLDFVLYFNIAFFSILGLGMFFGFLRGFKKSLFSFIVTLIFFVVFFLTIDIVINALWTMNLPFMGGLLANLDPALSGISSFSALVPAATELYLGDSLGTLASNVDLLEFATGLGMFALKIVYTLLYFTVIQIIYRLITFLIRIIFFNTKKSERKYRSQNRGFGALFGLLSGVMSLYVTLIIFGGFMSISESLLTFSPEDFEQIPVEMQFPRQEMYQASYSVIPLADPSDPMAALGESIALLESMVLAYNTNIIVTTTNQVTINDAETDEDLPMNLYLFDSVLSFEYREQKVPLRHELSVFANVASTILDSAFFDSQNLSDITGNDIRDSFSLLAQSNLFTSILPLVIEIGSEYSEVDIPVPVEELYDIDWKDEIQQIGEVAALVFDFVNTAGVFDEGINLETVVFDGDDAREIFDALGDSQLVTLAAYVAIEPLLEMGGEQIQAIVTVPEDLNWGEEFVAMGNIIGAVLDTEVTLGDLQSGDPMLILGSIASLDFTVILESKIITQALINILQGAGGLISDDILAFLDIPDGIIWLDEYNDLGVMILKGELHELLEALNAITTAVADVDFANIGLNTISELNLDSIDAIFDSKILVASLTKTLKAQDFGDFALIIPDSVYDDEGYLKKSELISLVDALQIISTELACEVDDSECASLGFDMNKAFSLSSESIDTVLVSDILWATLGNMVLDMGAEFLLVPDTEAAKTLIYVDQVELYVVSRLEINYMFQAVTTLGITDINNLEFDASMITDIASDETKVDTLMQSVIIAATVGDLLYDMGSDVLTIPDSALEEILVSEVAYTVVTQAEIKNLLMAVSTLGITDIEGMAIDPSILTSLALETDTTVLDEDKADTLFESLIIHATLSQVLLDLASGESAVIIVPYLDQDEEEVRYQNLVDTFEWITTDELKALVRAILVLDITDFESIAIDTLDLDMIIANSTIILQSAILHATISDQFVNLSADMIIIPEYNALGDTQILIEVGSGETATIYILASEIEKTLDAIQVLNLDLQNPTVDATIIDELASTEDPTVLDDDLLDTLFESSIIQASLSKMILDFTEGTLEDPAILVVPYKTELDQDVRVISHGTEFITKIELINLFKAFHSLDLTDFDSVDSLDIDLILDNYDSLIASATLHATISDQVINMESDAVVVPAKNLDGEDIIISVGEIGFETTYVKQSELRATFDALKVLGIDFNNPTFDASIIDNLQSDADPSVLDDAKLDTLFDSTIIHASVSKMLFDLAVDGETSAVLIVPQKDADDIDLQLSPYGTDFIVDTELKSLLKALKSMNITDFNNIDALNLNDVIDNFDILIDSAILHATISDQVINLESDAVVIPDKDLLGSDIIIVTGDAGFETTYVSETELRNTFDALDVMGVDFNSPAFDASIINNLALESLDPDVHELDDDKLDIVFSSSIIHASISKMLFDLAFDDGVTEPVLVVPFKDSDDVDVQVSPFGTDFVTEIELRSAFKAMYALDITSDFNAVDNLYLSDINDNFDVIILSAILHATISDQMLTLNSADVSIPYFDVLGNEIRIVVGVAETETTYIDKTELENTFTALELLGIDDLTNVDVNIVLTDFYDQPNRDILMASAIVHSAISKQLVELGEDVLEVPFFDQDNLAIRITQGDELSGTDTEYVAKSEVDALFEVMEILEIPDLDHVNIDLDLTTFYDEPARDILLGAASVQLEISKQLIELGPETLAIPYIDIDDFDIRILRGVGLTESEYVVKTEIHAMFEVMELLGITGLDSVNITLDLNDFYGEGDVTKRDTLMASASIHAEISKQILAIDDLTLDVPFVNEDDDAIRITRGDSILLTDTEYIIKAEIQALFEVLELLGINDFDTVDMTLQLSDLYDVETRDILLDSASVHLKISSQMLALGEAVLHVPAKDVDSEDIQVLKVNPDDLIDDVFIISDEIHLFFEGLEILGLPIDNIDDFDGSIDLNILYIEANRIELLKSATMHMTISDQLLNLDPLTITVPTDNIEEDLIVRLTVDASEFIHKNEIHAFFDGLNALGLDISDISEFDGTFDLTRLYDEGYRTTILESAIMHATFSKQIIDLDPLTMTVPAKDVSSHDIRVTVGTTEFVVKSEIHALLEAIEALDLPIADIGSFTGTFDMTKLYDVAVRNTLLESASVHATISNQILALDGDQISIPNRDVSGLTMIRLTIDIVEFIDQDEIHAFFESIESLGLDLSVIGDFDGTISLDNFFKSTEPVNYGANQTTLLASAIIHATISQQMLDLEDTILNVPQTDVDGSAVRELVFGTEFVYVSEIKKLIDALDIIGVGNIATFDGVIDISNVYDGTNQDTLLLSASMHATISDQINGLDGSALVIPDKNLPDFGDPELTIKILESGTNFILKSEVKALIEALEILGVDSIDGFDGSITLTAFFASDTPDDYDTNQDLLLMSAIMHATISDQILGLSDAALIVPDTDVDGSLVQELNNGTQFIYKIEIKAIINALDVLGVGTSIDSMTGSFTLANINTSAKQDLLMLSASMHATISQKVFDVDDNILTVPLTRQDNLTAVQVSAGLLGFERDFVVKDEIKALIDSLIIMGYGDLSSFSSEFELTQIFTDPDTVLLSASIQAMFSDRLLNDTGSALVIPNEFYITANDIRIVLADVTYIDYDELVALINSLDLLGLNNFTTFSFSPANIFLLTDFDELLASEIMQATISANLLASPTLDETAIAGSGVLIVPTFFRQTINVGVGSDSQIELDELKDLLTALKLLGISDFGDGMDPSAITDIFIDPVKRTTFLDSGSMHITTDNMIHGNAFVGGSIPTLAQYIIYTIANVTTKDEIVDFILAANAMSGDDFTAVDFSFASILVLTPAQQDVILNSMIVRNKITPDVVSASLLPKSLIPYIGPYSPALTNTDYMENLLTNFLRKTSIQSVIDYYS